MKHEGIIICPDCGKHVSYDHRCPKCGGVSVVTAGHNGAVLKHFRTRNAELLAALGIKEAQSCSSCGAVATPTMDPRSPACVLLESAEALLSSAGANPDDLGFQQSTIAQAAQLVTLAIRKVRTGPRRLAPLRQCARLSCSVNDLTAGEIRCYRCHKLQPEVTQ